MSEDARLLTILAIILNLEILFELRGEWNEEWFDGFVVSGFVFFCSPGERAVSEDGDGRIAQIKQLTMSH